jgi:hypothetical protein
MTMWKMPDPPEPGPEVAAVRDRSWVLWQRDSLGAWWRNYGQPGIATFYMWADLLFNRGPLTDVSDTDAGWEDR